jgi:CRISPR-associated exonuclease Cas4
MGYETDEYLPISGLQHLMVCERQCALIHVDGVWADNVHTTAGNLLHERVDGGKGNDQKNLRVERRVALRCTTLQLIGFADAVEFRRKNSGWIPYPVEYKRGRRKAAPHDDVQLCAQALCLEEMMQVEVPEGAIFYGTSQRRRIVPINQELRAVTAQAAARFHELVKKAQVPAAVSSRWCQECSLRNKCLPNHQATAKRSLRNLFLEAISL